MKLLGIEITKLERFKKQLDPIACIGFYLEEVFIEAKKRGYNFQENKIYIVKKIPPIKVTNNQIKYEFYHLIKKLFDRDPLKYKELINIKEIMPHPLFKIIEGDIESWEKTKNQEPEK